MLNLALDGGGTKLNALLFDEDFHVIARGRGGGVNATQNGEDAAAKSVADCLDQVLDDDVDELDAIYVIFVGDVNVLLNALKERVRYRKIVYLDEARAGLIAGAGRYSGLLALSGTGSDVFNIHTNPDVVHVVGGLGPILGDQGSGVWIGMQAIRAVGRDYSGWGEKTSLTNAVMTHFAAEKDIFDVVAAFHNSGKPYAVAASLVPIVAQEAYAGDAVALQIFRGAGETLARQMIALLQKDPVWEGDSVTLCGGAWKSHPAMKRSFEEKLHTEYPTLHVNRPWFEHVVAGMMDKALNSGLSREEAHVLLAKNCANECLDERNLAYERY